MSTKMCLSVLFALTFSAQSFADTIRYECHTWDKKIEISISAYDFTQFWVEDFDSSDKEKKYFRNKQAYALWSVEIDGKKINATNLKMNTHVVQEEWELIYKQYGQTCVRGNEYESRATMTYTVGGKNKKVDLVCKSELELDEHYCSDNEGGI